MASAQTAPANMGSQCRSLRTHQRPTPRDHEQDGSKLQAGHRVLVFCHPSGYAVRRWRLPFASAAMALSQGLESRWRCCGGYTNEKARTRRARIDYSIEEISNQRRLIPALAGQPHILVSSARVYRTTTLITYLWD